MSRSRLSIACLIVFTASSLFLSGCQSTDNANIKYHPEIPPVPELTDPGRPVVNADETEELYIIMIQAQNIQKLLLWADTVKKICYDDQPGD